MENNIDVWYEEDDLISHRVQARLEAIASNQRMMNVMLRIVEVKLLYSVRHPSNGVCSRSILGSVFLR